MAPDIRIEQPAAFLSLGPRPTLITGYLRMWFAAHFSDPALIENPQLRSYLWQEANVTGILVEDVLKWKPSTTELRPAILIGDGDWNLQRWGIDDRMQGESTPDGHEYRACGAAGTHTLFGLSALPAEAKLLGAEVYRDLLQFGYLIRDELGLHRFVVAQLGKVFRVKEARAYYACPVTVAYTVQEQWRVFQHTPFMSDTEISIAGLIP